MGRESSAVPVSLEHEASSARFVGMIAIDGDSARIATLALEPASRACRRDDGRAR